MTGRINRRQAAAALLVLAALAAIEFALGRPTVCTCGRIGLWSGVVNGPENSQMLADWYSLSHLVHGLLFYAAAWFVARRQPVGHRLVGASLVEAAWELIENSPMVIDRYRAATIALGYSGDSILNSAGDLGFMMLGFLLATRLPVRASIALGVALELLALAAIRDNLTLNVVMLLHPVDAIRVWQGG